MIIEALKGRNAVPRRVVNRISPSQGFVIFCPAVSQGVAQGYHIRAIQARGHVLAANRLAD